MPSFYIRQTVETEAELRLFTSDLLTPRVEMLPQEWDGVLLLLKIKVMPYYKECDVGVDNFDVSTFRVHFHEETPADPPKRIIHEGKTITVCFDWTQVGLLPAGNWLNPDCHYICRAYLEAMGPAESGPDIQIEVPVVQGSASYDYANQHVAVAGLTEGVYKVVVTLNFYNPATDATIFHSFDEKGFIEVVKP